MENNMREDLLYMKSKFKPDLRVVALCLGRLRHLYAGYVLLNKYATLWPVSKISMYENLLSNHQTPNKKHTLTPDLEEKPNEQIKQVNTKDAEVVF